MVNVLFNGRRLGDQLLVWIIVELLLLLVRVHVMMVMLVDLLQWNTVRGQSWSRAHRMPSNNHI